MKSAILTATIAIFAASGATAQDDMSLTSLVNDGFAVSQMSVLSVSDEDVNILLLLTKGDSAFLCKAEAGLDFGGPLAVFSDEPVPSILGLISSGTSKWRKCANIY